MRFVRRALRRDYVSRGQCALELASATAMPQTLGSIYCAADVLGSLARVTWTGRTTWGETVKRGQDGLVTATGNRGAPGARGIAPSRHVETELGARRIASVRRRWGIALEGLTTTTTTTATAQTIPVGHCKGGCPRPPVPTSGGGGLRSLVSRSTKFGALPQGICRRRRGRSYPFWYVRKLLPPQRPQQRGRNSTLIRKRLHRRAIDAPLK